MAIVSEDEPSVEILLSNSAVPYHFSYSPGDKIYKMRSILITFVLVGVVNSQPADIRHRGYNYDHQTDRLGSGSDQYISSTAAGQPDEPIINKHFYIHSAPEEPDSNRPPKHFTLGKAQKNYRVVFIRAPASSIRNTQLSAEYAPQEEKTHIYVLSQKEQEINVNDIATPSPTQPSKPEVFFIKYQTPEEAQHAQKQIQAQYDALGGASQISDEGTAPHSSFVGSLSSSTQPPPPPPKVNYIPPKPSNSYLPARRF